MRDGVLVNRAAMRTVKVVFPKVVDVRCFSYAIDGIGSHFNIPTLRRFVQLWNALFGHSPATRIAWEERTQSKASALLFSPCHITQLCPVANDVDVLTSNAFLNDAAMIANMKNEPTA